MAKLTKALRGVVAGEIYPREILAGDDCPPELEAAAREIGALAENKARKAPETK
jgi:hypothetical protein